MTTIASRQMHIAHIAGVPAGGLVVYASQFYSGTVTIRLLDEHGKEGRAFYADLQACTENGEKLKASIFPHLLPANYKVIQPGYTTIGRTLTVFPGEVATVDFR
jgi:hypothetical protein